MKILLCGGGTAGHVYPAIAISEIIKRNNPDSEFAYVVTAKGIENELVKYKKYSIEACGLKRKAFISNIRTVLLTIKAIKRSKQILKDFKPDIVIGTGGYSCFPVIYAAHKMGIKTAIHESNARPGKTTLLLSKYLDLIMLNYEESKDYFKDSNKVKAVGTPIREDFIKSECIEKNNKNEIMLLCFGGSLGAEKINECALLIIREIILKKKNVHLLWGCGRREYDKCKLELDKMGADIDRVELKGYIENIPEILPKTDIVICRAGAMSISEMAYNGKCAIFIPSPNVTDNHQVKNAKALANMNAAVMITEDKLEMIVPTLEELINDSSKRKALEDKISEFCNYDSNKMIYNEIIKLI